MTTQTQEQRQGKEERAYELLKKTRESQGLPLEASSTLRYIPFDNLILIDKREDRLGNHRVQEHNNSGYEERCFVEQRWLMTLSERDFRIAHNYYKNDTGLIGNPIYKKLTKDRPPHEERPDGSWAVEHYYIGRLKARTLTEEEYNFVLNTPINDLYTQTLERFGKMEDLPLEAKLDMRDRAHLTITPLTLGLANLKTLNRFKDWIIQDKKFWGEQKPLLEKELAKIKGLQKLTFDSTERQRYKSPWSTRYNPYWSMFYSQLMEWNNREYEYVRGRAFLERDVSTPRIGNERVCRIPKSTFDYFQDSVYFRLSNLRWYIDHNPNQKGANAIRRFAEKFIDLIKERKIKEQEYNAILNVTKPEELLNLAIQKGRRIRAKQKRSSSKPLYISPLTLRLLHSQMKSFVENRGYFPDKSERDIFLENTLGE